ncbi:hypothetical protein LTR36_003730, partial [Oleoguttula mirabilis]
MAPSPLMIPRKRVANEPNVQPRSSPSLTIPILATSILLVAVATLHWARRWLLSGCAIESLIILYGSSTGSRIFHTIPLYALLATLNLVYAVSATSWLLYGLFAATCYPSILLTCLFQFTFVADFARKSLRRFLRQLHFTRDKIALFNLPALEIDTEVNGLFVLRGVTISLSSLTIVAHGIELGKPEMTFGNLGEEVGDTDDDSVFLGDTPLLRAATAGSKGFDRPKLRESLTGVDWMKDSSAKAGFESVKTLSPDDMQAEKMYLDTLTDIRTTSAVYQSRQQVLKRSKTGEGLHPDDDKSMRAAICAELQDVPSIMHPPKRSVKVTTLQNLSKPGVRRFMHRLPLLLRLLLSPLSYFHPVNIGSINIAGSGMWLTALLQQEVFKHYANNNAELRRLARRISAYFADANFCLEVADIEGLGQVPISTDFDIVSYLHFADIMAYRTVTQSATMAQVVRLGGADCTIAIPSFLLPHHEHILPSRPTGEAEAKQAEEVEHADGLPKTIQAERELEKLKKDETNIKLSVHGSLPASFDQSLLNFIAALVKATKIIEMEKQADEVVEEAEVPMSPPAQDDPVVSTPRTDSGFKSFMKNTKQGLKDGSTREAIKEFARDVQQQTSHGMKKVVVGGIINDRWIAKMVGKVAANLEKAQGDIGYSGEIPIALEPYRIR